MGGVHDVVRLRLDVDLGGGVALILNLEPLGGGGSVVWEVKFKFSFFSPFLFIFSGLLDQSY